MNTIKLKDEENIPNKFTGIVEWEHGTKQWYKEGSFHRLNAPAVEFADGTKYWYKEGKPHREDGPAIEYPNGEKHWYKEGKRHRVDGPAIELPNGEKEWWIEGMYYAPAILSYLIQFAVYLGTEKGNHNLPWLRFLTEEGIEEFPLIPGMNQDKNFKKLLIHSYNS